MVLGMQICILGYANTRFWLRKDTGAMNRPLRLAECSQPISWVSVGISRNVCWYLAECFVCISLLFATLSQSVSSIIANR